MDCACDKINQYSDEDNNIPKCTNNNNNNTIDLQHIQEKKMCKNDKLKIQTNQIYNESEKKNICWNNSVQVPPNSVRGQYMGILDYNKQGQLVQKCCKRKQLYIPNSSIMNENIFEPNSCFQVNMNNGNYVNTNIMSSASQNISGICSINNTGELNHSNETVNFCKQLDCCSNFDQDT
tara:strand:+ start:755 stop:1288 length:534 start_codon:yes stop_codon:yes gene_type:complete